MRKEILLNFIFTFTINLLAFIQNKYFVQYMGVETLGMMKLFTQLLTYLNIVEMGLGSASTFALYKPLADKDYNKLSIVVNTIENIYNKIAILLLVLGILCTPILPFFMKVNNFSNEIYFYWILYVLNTVSTYLFIKYVILFTANQEFLYVRTIQSSCAIIFKFLQIFCIIKFHSFFIYIILLITDNLIQWLFFNIHYKKKYFYIFKTKEKFDGIKNDIKNLFWHKLGWIIVFNTDLILISKFTSLEVVGVYASYQMILMLLRTTVVIVTNVLTPKVGKFIAQNNKLEVYNYFKKLNILYYFTSCFFSFCTVKLINSFVLIWLGNIKLLNDTTVSLLCLNLLLILPRSNLENFKEGAGFFDDIKSPILASTINLVTSIILGLKTELDGVIIGTIVSNIIVILIYKPILVFERCFDKNWKEYIKVYGNYFILITISFIALNFITKPFIQGNINSWLEWIIYAIKISSISLIVITLIFLTNKDFRNLIQENIRIGRT